MAVGSDLGHTASVGGGSSPVIQIICAGFGNTSSRQETSSCGLRRKWRNGGDTFCGRACLSKIALVSGAPKSSEPADENDDVKLTNA